MRTIVYSPDSDIFKFARPIPFYCSNNQALPHKPFAQMRKPHLRLVVLDGNRKGLLGSDKHKPASLPG